MCPQTSDSNYKHLGLLARGFLKPSKASHMGWAGHAGELIPLGSSSQPISAGIWWIITPVLLPLCWNNSAELCSILSLLSMRLSPSCSQSSLAGIFTLYLCLRFPFSSPTSASGGQLPHKLPALKSLSWQLPFSSLLTLNYFIHFTANHITIHPLVPK